MKQRILSLMLALALFTGGCGADKAETASEASTERSTEVSTEINESDSSVAMETVETNSNASEEGIEDATLNDVTNAVVSETAVSSDERVFTYEDCQNALTYIQYFSNKNHEKMTQDYNVIMSGLVSLYNSGEEEKATDMVVTFSEIKRAEEKAKEKLDSEVESLNKKYDYGKENPFEYLSSIIPAFEKYKEEAGVSDNDIE